MITLWYLQAQLKNAKVLRAPEPSAITELPSDSTGLPSTDGGKAEQGELKRFIEFTSVCIYSEYLFWKSVPK